MNLTAMFIAALMLLPAIALAAWGRWCLTQVEEDLLAASGFDGLHFDV